MFAWWLFVSYCQAWHSAKKKGYLRHPKVNKNKRSLCWLKIWVVFYCCENSMGATDLTSFSGLFFAPFFCFIGSEIKQHSVMRIEIRQRQRCLYLDSLYVCSYRNISLPTLTFKLLRKTFVCCIFFCIFSWSVRFLSLPSPVRTNWTGGKRTSFRSRGSER